MHDLLSLLVTLLGVELAAESSDDISENSTMTRSLCVRLVGLGEGLERDINITLVFDNVDLNYTTEGTYC